jgi:hypothetical protein
MSEELLKRIKERPNDAPLETERLLDDAAAEIVRLREMLLEEGINSDPEPPPPLYGPPTVLQHMVSISLQASADSWGERIARHNTLLDLLRRNERGVVPGSTLKIRAPADFKVKANE